MKFEEITHPALALLDKEKERHEKFQFNVTEYEMNKKRVEIMSDLTDDFRDENRQLSNTINELKNTLNLQIQGMAGGFALVLVLTLVLAITMVVCLCKHARTINSVAEDLGPETNRISCCPC